MSIGKNEKPVENNTLWDLAIRDAKQRIKQLRFSIKTLEEHRDAGHEWAKTKAGTDEESIPAV